MSSIVIANLGTGNLHSVQKAVEFVAGDKAVMVSQSAVEIAAADHLVLPGQGALGTWINQLSMDGGLMAAVKARLADGPVLGICLGLQALFVHSQEDGGTAGLSVIEGEVRHFSDTPEHQNTEQRLKVPHMGWNTVQQKGAHPLWHGINDGERFYFVHSYFAEAAHSAEITGECVYGNTFTAAVARDNIFAVQFHPEKSQAAGLQLIKNFINWNGSA